MKKYKVFRIWLGWCDAMFIFNDTITFRDIKNNPETNKIEKNNYVGEYELDDNFLLFFETNTIENKKYYKRYSYSKEIKISFESNNNEYFF